MTPPDPLTLAAEARERAIERAALKWCGQKDRETFLDDVQYFRRNWKFLPGLTAFVIDELATALTTLSADLAAAREEVADLQIALDMQTSETMQCLEALEKERAEVARLRAERDTPTTDDWFDGTRREAAHQQARWGAEGDAGKSPLDWFWLIGYLAQKAATSQMAGDTAKATHHTISTAAALLNWHRHIVGERGDMRPGIADPTPPSPAPDRIGFIEKKEDGT